jgi:hypothetical protein
LHNINTLSIFFTELAGLHRRIRSTAARFRVGQHAQDGCGVDGMGLQIRPGYGHTLKRI